MVRHEQILRSLRGSSRWPMLCGALGALAVVVATMGPAAPPGQTERTLRHIGACSTELLEYVAWDPSRTEAVWLVGRAADHFGTRTVGLWSLSEGRVKWYKSYGPPLVPDAAERIRPMSITSLGEGTLDLVEVRPASAGDAFETLARLPLPPAEFPPQLERDRLVSAFLAVNRFDRSGDGTWIVATSYQEGWIAAWRRSDPDEATYELVWHRPAGLPLNCRVLRSDVALHAVFVAEPRRLVFVDLGTVPPKQWEHEIDKPVTALTACGRWSALVDASGGLQVFELTQSGPRRRASAQLAPHLKYQLAGTGERLLVTGSDGGVRLLRLPSLEPVWEQQLDWRTPLHPFFGPTGTPYVVQEAQGGELRLLRLPDGEQVAVLAGAKVERLLVEPYVARPAFLHIDRDPLRILMPGASWQSTEKGFLRTCYGELIAGSLQWMSVEGGKTVRFARWYDVATSGQAIVELAPYDGKIAVRRVTPPSGYAWLVSRPYQGLDYEGCHLLCGDTSQNEDQVAVLSLEPSQRPLVPIGPRLRNEASGQHPGGQAVSAVWLPDHRLLRFFVRVRTLPGQFIQIDVELWRLAQGSWLQEHSWPSRHIRHFDPVHGPWPALPHPPVVPIGRDRFVMALPNDLHVVGTRRGSSQRLPVAGSTGAGPWSAHLQSLLAATARPPTVAVAAHRARGFRLPVGHFIRPRALLMALLDSYRQKGHITYEHRLTIWRPDTGERWRGLLPRPPRAVSLCPRGELVAAWYDRASGRQEVDVYVLDEGSNR